MSLPELPDTPYSLFYEQPGDFEDEGYQYVMDEPGYTADQMRAYALQAVEALRPVAMTEEQAEHALKRSDLLEMFLHIGWYSAPRKGFDQHALSLIRAVEAHHGITQKEHGK